LEFLFKVWGLEYGFGFKVDCWFGVWDLGFRVCYGFDLGFGN
jgi:hypothetical protein